MRVTAKTTQRDFDRVWVMDVRDNDDSHTLWTGGRPVCRNIVAIVTLPRANSQVAVDNNNWDDVVNVDDDIGPGKWPQNCTGTVMNE